MQTGWTFSGRAEDDWVVAAGHVVWRDPEGALLDITPRLWAGRENLPGGVPPLLDARGRLLFLPHPVLAERPLKYLPLNPRNKALVKACRRWSQQAWREYHDQGGKAVVERVERLHRELA
jgi:hypothetical protein